jgi:uncharacterized protein (TIGR02231 family)
MPIPTTSIGAAVVAVTVFPDRARVTRAVQAALTPGIQRLQIEDLPLAILPDSVRAGGRGTARAKLLGVATRLEHFQEAPAEAVQQLEGQIRTLEDGDADLVAEASLTEKELKHLETLAAQSEMFARGLALRNRTLEEQGAFFDFIDRRARDKQARLLAIMRRRREMAKEIDVLRRRLSAMTSAQPRQRYVAMVELEVASAGDFELELTYVVNGAGWQPLYDIRLADATIDLTYLAEVHQNTGEDWQNVALTLSTARPSLSLVIPELQPWYLRQRPPMPMAPQRAEMRVMAAAPMPAGKVAAAMQSMSEPVEEMYADSAAVSESGASLTYKLPGMAEVPGNGEPRKVTVATLQLKPDLTYVTAPKLEPVFYRRAEIKNTTEYSLLPGSAQLFEGAEYLGATHLSFVAPGQTFELALGADERLRVKRELAGRDVDKAFIIGDRRRIRYGYNIEVENLRDTPQVITVRDQIPVTRDEQIRVKLEQADPKPTEQTELNLLEWKLTLDRGAKRTIHYEYSVEHPRAMDVIGIV